MMSIKEILKSNAELMDEYIISALPAPDSDYPVIFDAVKYSAESGGKRIRPTLTLEFCRMLGGKDEDALVLAAALEMIHTYSLIHDDLPCMDNDDLRRGKPTNHKVFGEDVATLAGDALLTYAFELIVSSSLSDDIKIKAVKALSYNAGMYGMIGGQVMDMQGEKTPLTKDELYKMNRLKTGCLIKCACIFGILAASNTVSVPHGLYGDAEKYADGIGVSFQITDDILDVIGDEKLFGKPIGSDIESGKTTFTTVYTVQEASQIAKELTDSAIDAISKYPASDVLTELAKQLLSRQS